MKNLLRIEGFTFIMALSLMGQTAKAQNTNSNVTFHDVTTRNHAPGRESAMNGVFSVKPDIISRLVAANNLGVDYVRERQVLTRWNGIKNINIDFWKTHKKKVLLNINNDTTPSAFPTNLVAYEAKLRSFLNVYSDSIELAVIENEELNQYDSLRSQDTLCHFGSMQDYINELTVAVNVCRQKGIAVTNGGLTGPVVASLRHYYAINGKQDSVNWLVQHIGVGTDPTLWLRADSLLSAFKDLPLSYVNLHWYEPAKAMSGTSGVLQVVCNYITQQTGKKVITNETGVKTNDSSFVKMLVEQWESTGAEYCLFFDGAGAYGAQPLTSITGGLLSNGIAFRNYITNANSCDQSITVSPARFVVTCFGNNVTLTASEGFSNYLWSNGETSRSISVNSTDNYSVTSPGKNCMAFSNAVALMVNPSPAKPVINPSPLPPNNVCSKQIVKLISPDAPGYLWNTGDTTKLINVSKGGNYFVTISDINGCKNTSDPVTVAYQKCNAPTNLRVTDIAAWRATLNWNTEGCAVSYQFHYREKGTTKWTVGQVVQQSTSSRVLYGLKPSATYEWKIFTACKLIPDTVRSRYVWGPDFTTPANFVEAQTGNEDAKSARSFDEKIFPVPAKNIATLTVNYISYDLKIILTDLSGKVLWQSEKITDKNISIPVAGLSSGIYMIVVTDKERKKTLRLIKE